MSAVGRRWHGPLWVETRLSVVDWIPPKAEHSYTTIIEELLGMDYHFTDLRADFVEVLDEVSGLLSRAYEQLGPVPDDHVLAQKGFKNGKEIVLDYVDHNEAGIAYEHLMYMIDGPSLVISGGCRAAVDRIAKSVKRRCAG
jgi:hypothetical protein